MSEQLRRLLDIVIADLDKVRVDVARTDATMAHLDQLTTDMRTGLVALREQLGSER